MVVAKPPVERPKGKEGAPGQIKKAKRPPKGPTGFVAAMKARDKRMGGD